MPNYYSQHGEDFILDLLLAGRSSGYFVEVGCIDGRRFSNTLTFEERGWRGLCVEAHAGFIEALRANRPRSVVCHCAAAESDQEGATFFANERGSLSTLDGSKEDEFREGFGDYFVGFEEQVVEKRRLDTLLETHAGSVPIDILSLDIEGYENEALRGMDLTRFRPRIFVVESDDVDHERLLDAKLLGAGYTKAMRLKQNIFYLDDADLASRVTRHRYTVELIHTAHPCDDTGDAVQTCGVQLHHYTRANPYTTRASPTPSLYRRVWSSFRRLLRSR